MVASDHNQDQQQWRRNYESELQGFIPDFVSPYHPRKGGIAEFTRDTLDALAAERDIEEVRVQAIDKDGLKYRYPVNEQEDVIDQLDSFSWKENGANRIVERARERESDGYNVVAILEHEYGLDGDGSDYNYNKVSEMLDREGIPHLAVLHTILEQPNDYQREVIEGLGKTADRLVYLTPSSQQVLTDVYGVDQEKTAHISHGVPTTSDEESESEIKDKWGLRLGGEDRVVVSTVGLLSEGKGIEYGIKGFSQLLDDVDPSFRDKLVYVVAGQTHPEVKKREGEQYRERVFQIAEEEGLNPVEVTHGDPLEGDSPLDHPESQALFLNRYLEDHEFREIIESSDVLLLPYRNEEQTSSGPLFYGVGLGRPVVATNFIGARDLFSDQSRDYDRSGVLAEIDSPESIADSLRQAFEDARNIEVRALKKGVTLGWNVIGREYRNLLIDVAENPKEIEYSRVPFVDQEE